MPCNVIFVGIPSQCIYMMIQGFLLCIVFDHGFLPILILGFFVPFWREWGYVTINSQLHCIYGGRNNKLLHHIWWNYNCEFQNEGNNSGIMMYNYGLGHREISEHFLVLTTLQWISIIDFYT